MQFMIPEYKEYILEKLVRIVNVYAENFLSDHVLLAIISQENKKEFKNSFIVYKFAKVFLKNVKEFLQLDKL